MNPNSPAFSMMLMVLLIVMVYFLMIRPQRKKDKEDRAMREAMKVGDEAITIGGIVGKIEKINEKTVVISTTAGKNKIEFLKTAIASVSPKEGGQAKAESKTAPKEEAEEKTPSRDKKVTPKKLGKKEEPKDEK